MEATKPNPLSELNTMYEEAKDALDSLQILEEDHYEYSRVYQILRQMRDLAATQMQSRERLIVEVENTLTDINRMQELIKRMKF